MPIISCPYCASQVPVTGAHAGNQLTCPACAESIPPATVAELLQRPAESTAPPAPAAVSTDEMLFGTFLGLMIVGSVIASAYTYVPMFAVGLVVIVSLGLLIAARLRIIIGELSQARFEQPANPRRPRK